MKDRGRGPRKNVPLINERIRARQIQLITHEGQNIGVVPRTEALQMATDAGLDLVVIADYGPDQPPIAKIMDFGKVEYEKKKKLSAAKKKQKLIKVKEIKFRPKISDHDFYTKLNQGIGFLKTGKHLKITLMFRGRERGMIKQLGGEMFEKINQALRKDAELKNIVQEKDMRAGPFWSRMYYLKD